MRDNQKELMEQYLAEIHEAEKYDKQEEHLFNIIKKEKRTIPHYVEIILAITLIITIIYAQTHGMYVRPNIVTNCQGDIITIDGIKKNWTLEVANEYIKEKTGTEGKLVYKNST